MPIGPVPVTREGGSAWVAGCQLSSNGHVRVLIVDDEAQRLQRWTAAVLADASLRLMGAVTSCAAAIALLNQCAPDVVLIDLGLSNYLFGIEVIRHAVKHCPRTRILVLAAPASAGHVLACVKAGATGYLLNNMPVARICVSIRELYHSGALIGPGMAHQILASFQPAPAAVAPAAQENGASHDGEPILLSQRESDILRLVAKGMALAEIGGVLSISPHTVVAHLKKIYRQLAVHSRGEAVFEASQRGLL